MRWLQIKIQLIFIPIMKYRRKALLKMNFIRMIFKIIQTLLKKIKMTKIYRKIIKKKFWIKLDKLQIRILYNLYNNLYFRNYI